MLALSPSKPMPTIINSDGPFEKIPMKDLSGCCTDQPQPHFCHAAFKLCYPRFQNQIQIQVDDQRHQIIHPGTHPPECCICIVRALSTNPSLTASFTRSCAHALSHLRPFAKAVDAASADTKHDLGGPFRGVCPLPYCSVAAKKYPVLTAAPGMLRLMQRDGQFRRNDRKPHQAQMTMTTKLG